jgi:hypothetical protein
MVLVTAGGSVAMARMRDAYASSSRSVGQWRIEEDGRRDGR